MPNKSRNTSRNTSRKSTASSQGIASLHLKNEDDFPSIVMLTKPSSSRKSTPTSKKTVSSQSQQEPESPRPDFLEPLSPKPDVVNTERINASYRQMDRKAYEDAVLDDMTFPYFWQGRIEHLEKEREYFNKKRGWSAIDIACVDRIDAQIHECEVELDKIYAQEDRLEAEYD